MLWFFIFLLQFSKYVSNLGQCLPTFGRPRNAYWLFLVHSHQRVFPVLPAEKLQNETLLWAERTTHIDETNRDGMEGFTAERPLVPSPSSLRIWGLPLLVRGRILPEQLMGFFQGCLWLPWVSKVLRLFLHYYLLKIFNILPSGSYLMYFFPTIL